MKMISVNGGTFALRSAGPSYEFVKVRAGSVEVEVVASPTGRSVQVHVNGKRVEVTP